MNRGHCIIAPTLVAAALVGFVASARAANAEGAAPVSDEGLRLFESTIRPVLLDHCLKCHGDDKPKANLQLTSRDLLLKGGSRGPAAVAGDPVGSLMIRALRHEGELKMPREGPRLFEQLPAFERWIALGLPWPGGDAATLAPEATPAGSGWAITDAQRAHWSFQPVRLAPPPVVQRASAQTSDLDRFILAKLEQHGLKPAGPADRHTLLRRVTFDLTGLPPTPEEVDAFVSDVSPEAFARVVDRLLASPAYGERWGRHWLDVVRYADTAGETADYPVREAYRYRDYVIASFNADKPYDRFIAEQIAGDILAQSEPPERYAENVTATGFLALSRRFGYDSENYHHLTIQDTLDTLGQAVLGLSIGCARCHDHKYDPVSAADYYALYGIFESTRYPFPGSEQKQKTRAMAPLLPPAEAGAAFAAFEQKLASVEALLAEQKVSFPRVTVANVNDIDGDFEVQARSNGGSLGVLVPPWVYTGTPEVTPNAQSAYQNVYTRAHRFDIPVGTVGVKFPAGEESHSIGQALRPARAAATHDRVWVNLDFRNMSPGAGSWRLCLGRGPGDSPAVEVFVTGEALFVRSGVGVEQVATLRQGEWYNLQLGIDLDAGTFGGTVATPAEASGFTGKVLSAGWDGTIDHVLIDGAGHSAGARPEHDVDNFAISDSPLPPLAGSPGAAPPPAPPAAPVAASAPPVAGQGASAGTPDAAPDSESLMRQLRELTDRGPCDMAYAVAEGTPTDSRMQLRGEPAKPGEVVPRRWLTILGGDALPPDVARLSSGRLELAQWLARPENPLTARVMVNRIWQHHFGAGLVATENDFGLRGQPPTHPELLDWLAARFVESGWSVKSMHRLILLSQAYQRSGAVDAAALAADPGNALLWRFNRRRLDAEAIRDAMLSVAGALDRTTAAGPHPFPTPQDWGFTQHTPFAAVYETDRRSVYLMTQRLKRHPFLGLFDGADANASTARRPVTTVPTQALFMMNSPFVHEQSARLATRLAAASPDSTQRIALAYKLALGREPTAEEISKATAFMEQYRQQLAAAGVSAAEHDAQTWAAFARTLLASNEFVFLD